MLSVIEYANRHVSIYYLVISLFISLVSSYVLRNRIKGCFVGYQFFVLFETVLMRTELSDYSYRLVLFWSYSHWEERNQIILNIFMFIPVGMIGWLLCKWWILLYAVSFSISIEFTQLITKRGMFEFDDMFHNCVGALIGVFLIIILQRLCNCENNNRDNGKCL